MAEQKPQHNDDPTETQSTTPAEEEQVEFTEAATAPEDAELTLEEEVEYLDGTSIVILDTLIFEFPESKMPVDIFDPLYPDILADYTVDRVLVSRLSLHLEKNRVTVGHNYPYLLPEGSMEVRHQVWRFFDWLHREFALSHPETESDPSFQLIWTMLKDTNHRSAESAALRSAVHLFRRATEKRADLYENAIHAYHRIRKFLHAPENDLVLKYRLDPMRCMSIGIEVRKDLVWSFAQSSGRSVFDFLRRSGQSTRPGGL